MSVSSVTIKEFVIKLGFKVDEQQFRNFQESLRKTTQGSAELSKAFLAVGKATVIGLGAAGLGLHKVAESMSGLFYASQRTGASAKELSALQYGFEQVGLSADQARGSVEALAAARRTNPGLNGLLANLGINPANLNNFQVFMQLLGRLRQEAPAIRAQYAQMFGLDESVLNQVELNGDLLPKSVSRRMEQFQRDGYDPDTASRKAAEFMRQWNEAKASYADMAQTIAVKLLPYAERLVKFLERTVDWLERTDKATGGWVIRLGMLSSILLPILTALKLTGGMNILGGLGRLAMGGGEAIGGLAASAGGLALPALIAIVIAAVAAWMFSHPQQMHAAAHAAVGTGRKVIDAVRHEVSALPGQLKTLNAKSQQLVGDLAKRTDFVGSMAKFTGNFEGYRDKVYKDIAGKLTIGVGHLIQPGEDFTGADRARLMQTFQNDLLAHIKHVLSMLRVNVNANQLKALADLDFNIGDANFDKSTLLKRLNAGDVAGAAQQFAAWNKIHKGGVLVPSAALTQRRAADAEMFRTPGDKTVTFNVKSEFNIDGSGNPDATARAIDARQRGTFSDMTRNFAGAFE